MFNIFNSNINFSDFIDEIFIFRLIIDEILYHLYIL